MFKIDDHIAVAAAGWTSDANILINYARVSAQRHTYTFQVRNILLNAVIMVLRNHCQTPKGQPSPRRQSSPVEVTFIAGRIFLALGVGEKVQGELT